jgi:hypothetical protein
MGYSSHSESSFLDDSISDEVTIYSEESLDPHASTYSFDEISIADDTRVLFAEDENRSSISADTNVPKVPTSAVKSSSQYSVKKEPKTRRRELLPTSPPKSSAKKSANLVIEETTNKAGGTIGPFYDPEVTASHHFPSSCG